MAVVFTADCSIREWRAVDLNERKAFGTPARELLIRQLDYELGEVTRRASHIKVEPFHALTAERRGGV